MGRSKQYDRDELLDRAVEVFRLQGYGGARTAELAGELQVNPKTMYAEFGSKQELFEAALEHYDRHHLTGVLGPVEAPDAGLAEIRAAFDGYGEAADGWARGRGCLLCNTAVERGALDPGAGRHVDAYFDRITRAFRQALENARRAGDVDPDADVDDLAAFLTISLVGVAASIRGQAPAAHIRAACRVAVSAVAARPAR